MNKEDTKTTGTNPEHASAEWDEKHGANEESLRDRSKAAARKASEAAKEKAADLRDSASAAMGTAKERGREVRESAASAMEDVKRRGGEFSQSARREYGERSEHLKESFEERPLAYAFGAFAAGLLIGLALPRGRRENSLIGEQAARVRRKGSELKHRSREAAEAAAERAREVAREQNLDPESMKESASKIGHEAAESAKRTFSR